MNEKGIYIKYMMVKSRIEFLRANYIEYKNSEIGKQIAEISLEFKSLSKYQNENFIVKCTFLQYF